VNIDHTLVNSVHGPPNCETGVLDCRVITTELTLSGPCIHMPHLFCKALLHVIHSVVSGQYSYTTHI